MKPIKNTPTLIDQRQFGLWKAFFFAFFSTRVYVDVAKRWPGLCLSYFLLLLIVATFPFGVRLEWAAYHYYKEHFFEPLKNLPEIIIENGQVQFNHFMPYRIVNQTGDAVAIIDTTGLMTTINHRIEPELTWLLTKNALQFNPPDLKVTPSFIASFQKSVHTEVFDEETDGVMGASEMLGTAWPKLLIYGGVILVYPCIIAAFFGIFSIGIAAFAWAAQYYVSVVFRHRIDYRATYRLLILALTAPLTICFFLAAFGIVFPEAGVYYLILFAVYFNLGALAVRRSDRFLVFA